MLRTIILMVVLLAAGCTVIPYSQPGDGTAMQRLVRHSIEDHRRHYSSDVLVDLLPPMLITGTLANTGADRWIRDSWQNDVRSETSDDVARVFLRFGDVAQNRFSLPLYSLAMLATGYSGQFEQDSPVATWAERSLRANVLGGPQAWALTYAFGSHRPTVGDSGWNPWNDNDGVSGHAFYGAVPLLTAARMSDHPGWKYSLYALSALPAYARINDNQHYASQVFMGWSLAWVATRTVAETDSGNSTLSVMPLLLPDGAYVAMSWTFR